jgi:hypothetical protein
MLRADIFFIALAPSQFPFDIRNHQVSLTVPKTKIGAKIGRLADEDMVRLNRALLVFLGIAAPTENEELQSQ